MSLGLSCSRRMHMKGFPAKALFCLNSVSTAVLLIQVVRALPIRPPTPPALCPRPWNSHQLQASPLPWSPASRLSQALNSHTPGSSPSILLTFLLCASFRACSKLSPCYGPGVKSVIEDRNREIGFLFKISCRAGAYRESSVTSECRKEFRGSEDEESIQCMVSGVRTHTRDLQLQSNQFTLGFGM